MLLMTFFLLLLYPAGCNSIHHPICFNFWTVFSTHLNIPNLWNWRSFLPCQSTFRVQTSRKSSHDDWKVQKKLRQAAAGSSSDHKGASYNNDTSLLWRLLQKWIEGVVLAATLTLLCLRFNQRVLHFTTSGFQSVTLTALKTIFVEQSECLFSENSITHLFFRAEPHFFQQCREIHSLF